MLTLKKLNELLEFYGLDLKASKPSLLSPFVLHHKNSDAWNNRIFEGKTLNELKCFVEGLVCSAENKK